MADQELLNYVKISIQRNIPLAETKQRLKQIGWPDETIEEAITQAKQLLNLQEKLIKKPEKKPRKPISKIAVVIFLIIVVLMGISTSALYLFNHYKKSNPSLPPTAVSQTDFKGFISASKNCQLASLAHPSTVILDGIQRTNTNYYEIRGMEAEKCLLFIERKDIQVSYTEFFKSQLLSSGFTEDQIIQQENSLKELNTLLIGTNSTCRFEKDDLVEILEKWDKDGFRISDLFLAQCQPELISY
ncbi:MAG: hypothetical protein ABIE22_01455 [archaeon]